MTFGKKLRTARLAAGLSQGELADDHCSLSYISHLETGRRSPTPELVRYFESRLHLAPGELCETLEVSTSQRKKVEEADLLEAYREAQESWQAGAFAQALAQAHRVRAALPNRGRDDLKTLLNLLLIDINIDLGHYTQASEEAQRHWRETAARGSLTLEAKAACLASRAARLAGEVPLAREAALTALGLTSGVHVSSTLRADALRTGIAALCGGNSESLETYIDELRRLTPALDRAHERGLSSWVLGNAELRSGNIVVGIDWHNEAINSLSASADLRNWARFPRASAEERLTAGTDSGVEDLLDIAQRRLEVLDSPDELATLALVRAKFASSLNRDQEALTHIATALEELDLPPLTQAELYLVSAKTHAQLGNANTATEEALRAVRLFTDAGHSLRAQEAWKIVDAQTPGAPPAR